MLFRALYDDMLAQAAYLIGCQRTGEALIVDPERDVDRYIEAAANEGLRITAIAETHIHADFLSGARELAERTGARLFLSAEGGSDWDYRWLDRKSGGGSYRYRLLHNGDRFMVGNIRVEAAHTPGHTDEHMSYLVTDLGGGADEPMGIVTGDFVFVGDVGRPDLLESAAGMAGKADPAARRLYTSIKWFKTIPEHLQVWPGHGAGSACGKALGAVPQTTVGYEKRFNPALDAAERTEDLFVDMIIEGQPEPPPYFARMKRENREGPALLGGLPNPPRMEVEMLAEAAGNDRVTILDARPWSEFREGHLAGSLWTPLNRSLATIAGSYVEPDREIHLVAEKEQVEGMVRTLIRIGLDRIAGFVTPSDLRDYAARGGILASTPEIDAEELPGLMEGEYVQVLDVRSATEYASGHLPWAINVAHTRLAPELDRIPATGTLYVHCRSGARSAAAVSYLRSRGIDAVNIRGGYERIREAISLDEMDPALHAPAAMEE